MHSTTSSLGRSRCRRRNPNYRERGQGCIDAETGCNGREETGCTEVQPVHCCESCTCAHEQPHCVCDHRCKAEAVSLAYVEQPKAETETDINRSDDPHIHRSKACHFGVVTE